MVARSIADTLEELCCQVDEIRSGASSPVRGNYSLLELEKLRDAFNRMEERLRLASSWCGIQAVFSLRMIRMKKFIGTWKQLNNGLSE